MLPTRWSPTSFFTLLRGNISKQIAFKKEFHKLNDKVLNENTSILFKITYFYLKMFSTFSWQKVYRSFCSRRMSLYPLLIRRSARFNSMGRNHLRQTVTKNEYLSTCLKTVPEIQNTKEVLQVSLKCIHYWRSLYWKEHKKIDKSSQHCINRN